MRIYLTFLLYSLIALFLVQAVNAEIYKSVDKQGRVTYTDKLPADVKATVVDLPSINALPPMQYIPVDSPVPNLGAVDVDYQVSIVSPVSGDTLQADERNLTVSINLDQDLRPGHVLAYLLDGYIVEKTTALAVTLVELPRGQHKLHVEVMSKYGKSLGQSNAVTVIVDRPIMHKNPVKVSGNQ